MRLEAFAAIYEARIIKTGKEAKLASVIKAQEEAAEAAKRAMQLYQEYVKESRSESNTSP
jgi:hypothetical protein